MNIDYLSSHICLLIQLCSLFNEELCDGRVILGDSQMEGHHVADKESEDGTR